VARDQAAVDDLITRLVIARLSQEDAAGLLARDRRDELAALNREASGIEELMSADRRLQQERLLTELEFAGGRRRHQAQLARVRQQIADAGQADVLAQLVGTEASQDRREAAVRDKWARLGLDRRRAVGGRADDGCDHACGPGPSGRVASGHELL
jgi:hypothetical protein